MTTQAWHFTAATLRDGRLIPPVGEWLVYDGPVEICKSGLHASKRVIDATHYASGLTLHRVTCDDVEAEHGDKFVCRRRRIDASRDVPMRALVRLAIESACLAAWCAGRYLPDLLVALDACDREDWAACAVAASAASASASAEDEADGDATTAYVASYAAVASYVAHTACSARGPHKIPVVGIPHHASTAAALEARAVALLWGE